MGIPRGTVSFLLLLVMVILSLSSARYTSYRSQSRNVRSVNDDDAMLSRAANTIFRGSTESPETSETTTDASGQTTNTTSPFRFPYYEGHHPRGDCPYGRRGHHEAHHQDGHHRGPHMMGPRGRRYPMGGPVYQQFDFSDGDNPDQWQHPLSNPWENLMARMPRRGVPMGGPTNTWPNNHGYRHHRHHPHSNDHDGTDSYAFGPMRRPGDHQGPRGHHHQHFGPYWDPPRWGDRAPFPGHMGHVIDEAVRQVMEMEEARGLMGTMGRDMGRSPFRRPFRRRRD